MKSALKAATTYYDLAERYPHCPILNGFERIEVGDVIEITGIVDNFKFPEGTKARVLEITNTSAMALNNHKEYGIYDRVNGRLFFLVDVSTVPGLYTWMIFSDDVNYRIVNKRAKIEPYPEEMLE